MVQRHRQSIFLVFILTLGLQAAPSRSSNTFEQGRLSYESGSYVRALDQFSRVIRSPANSGERNRAFYYQGLTLFEMGLYYSSFVSFRNVLLAADDKSREVYEKAIKNAVVIVDKLNMVEKMGKILKNMPPNLIPSSVSGFSHYAIGVYEFKRGNMDGASGYLKSVHPESPVYPKALLYLGITATKKKDRKEAAYYFNRLLELTLGKRELFDLQGLARLNLARTVYSAGDMEKSIEIYSQFLSSSPHWLTVLLEASWPLMRVSDTTVSLGNLHTVISPYYRDELLGEGYLLRSTILYSLCKYEEMRKTLNQFFEIYDPILRDMQKESRSLSGGAAFYNAFTTENGLNQAFSNFAKRDIGIQNDQKVITLLVAERRKLAKLNRIPQMRRMAELIDAAQKELTNGIGGDLQVMHQTKLRDLLSQREQANYLKVEIVTGEKELVEGQKGLPPKRVVDVETTVSAGYHFWPFKGEYWEDELGAYVYTTESSCIQ